MRISDWSSDVCSSDLMVPVAAAAERQRVVFWHLDRRLVRRLEDHRDSIAGMELWALRRLCPAFTGAGLARHGADGRPTSVFCAALSGSAVGLPRQHRTRLPPSGLVRGGLVTRSRKTSVRGQGGY